MSQKCNSLVFVEVTNKIYNRQNQLISRRFTTSTAINMLDGKFYWNGFRTSLFAVFESTDNAINNVCANEQIELARSLCAIAGQITTFEKMDGYCSKKVPSYNPDDILYPKIDTADLQIHYQKINALRNVDNTSVIGVPSPFRSLTNEQLYKRLVIRGMHGGGVTCLDDILNHELIKFRLEKGTEFAIFLNGTEVFSNIENWSNEDTGNFNDVFIQENGLVKNACKNMPISILDLNSLNVTGYHF